MLVWVFGSAMVALALPYALTLDRAQPSIAAAIWLSALAMRALVAVAAVLSVLLFLGSSEALGTVTHWCWHAALPLVPAHLGLNGHEVGKAATLAPALSLVTSAASTALGIWRVGRAVRSFVKRAGLGTGPAGSMIVGGPSVLLGAAGLKRPKIIVSVGALTELDDEELAAGLDHERGHIERQHRFVVLFAELCRAMGRFVPGSRAAMKEFGFHLERDADQWALKRRHSPLALASAICKATARVAPTPAMAGLGGHCRARRIEQLLHAHAASGRHTRRERTPRAVATVMIVLTLLLAGSLPATTAAGVNQLARDKSFHTC